MIRGAASILLALLAVVLTVGTVWGMRKPVQWTLRDSGMSSLSIALEQGSLAVQWTGIKRQATPTSEEALVELGYKWDMANPSVRITGGGTMTGWPPGTMHINRFGLMAWTMTLPTVCRATWVAPRALRYRHAFGGSAVHVGVVRVPAWPVIVLAAIYPTWFLIRRPLLRRRRRKAGLCVRCGYDLTGNETGVCSECGVKR